MYVLIAGSATAPRCWTASADGGCRPTARLAAYKRDLGVPDLTDEELDESLGAHRFHLCYTITRHKTCHVSGGYISAAIRARSTSSRAVTAPACAGCRGHLDRLDDPAGSGAAQRGPVRVGELGHREVVADLPEHLWHPRPPGPRSPRSTASGALAGVKPH